MVEVSTSILSVREGEEAQTLLALEQAQTDYFHIDVMDGKFVKQDTRDFMVESVQTLKQIFEENFTDPDIDQNGSPSIREMLEFSGKWNNKYVFGGYAVEIWRDDYRVSLDSIWREDLEDLTKKFKTDGFKIFKDESISKLSQQNGTSAAQTGTPEA